MSANRSQEELQKKVANSMATTDDEGVIKEVVGVVPPAEHAELAMDHSVREQDGEIPGIDLSTTRDFKGVMDGHESPNAAVVLPANPRLLSPTTVGRKSLQSGSLKMTQATAPSGRPPGSYWYCSCIQDTKNF